MPERPVPERPPPERAEHRTLPRRVLAALRLRRPTGWALAVPFVFAVSGLVASASAQTARGTDLRSVGRTDTADVIREQQHRADRQESEVVKLREEVRHLTELSAPAGSQLAQLTERGQRQAAAAGATPVRGPAVSVRLDDAPHDGSIPEGFTADDLVVHQQDVQAVVNALWASGAEAMMLMDQRVISTSAVRCVGNVLILQGRVYSPPYTITAIGDPARLRRGLENSSSLKVYREYVDEIGLGYRVRSEGTVTMPGYDGSLDVEHVRAPAPVVR